MHPIIKNITGNKPVLMKDEKYPKISVVTVNYNKGKYIEETIKSVLDQNYPNLEYIIIDGASTDNSIEIIKKYEKQLSYFVSEPDEGMADALIKGFNRATGDIFAWINSDDCYAHDAFYVIANAYLKKPFDFIYGNGYFIDAQGSITRKLHKLPSSAKAMVLGLVPLLQPSCFWSRDLYYRVNGLNKDFKITMDGDLFTRMFMEKKAIIYKLKNYLCYFRIHPENSESWGVPGSYQVERKIISKYMKINTAEKYLYKIFYKPFALVKAILCQL